ncbi:MAG: ABC-F family ATP-binding cassette domain-containing protein, partial [Muribaculaceae bacterium]|nr:ABC-F family ATP-binding cassette domain-containing protein [Muribaculaceae bacterium]
MISVQGLKVEFSSQLLFDDVSFVVNKNDRIALVGRNGAGKSTLLKILKGIQNPTSGVVSRERDITIGYLPQEMKFTDDTSLKQEVKKVFSYIDVLDCQIEDLNNELSNRTDYDSESYQGIVELLSWKIEQRANFNVNSMEGEIEKTLIGLGFEKEDFERNTSEFSGGWRMRVEIAKILLVRPDILLLDEPTNHLDIESIQWLENFLRRNKSALVLVSHDKAFVDRTTNRTIEISLGKIYDFKVPYSQYVV